MADNKQVKIVLGKKTLVEKQREWLPSEDYYIEQFLNFLYEINEDKGENEDGK